MTTSFEELRKLTTKSFAASARTGVDLLEIERGYVKMMMPLKGNENHVNIMYAGSLFTLGELPGGAVLASAFNLEECYPIVLEMNIQFKNPATTDITVEARLSDEDLERIARELKERGKSIYKLEQALRDTNDVVVAVTTGTYMARAY